MSPHAGNAALRPAQNFNLCFSFLLILILEDLFFFAILLTFLISSSTSVSVPSNSTINMDSASLG